MRGMGASQSWSSPFSCNSNSHFGRTSRDLTAYGLLTMETLLEARASHLLLTRPGWVRFRDVSRCQPPERRHVDDLSGLVSVCDGLGGAGSTVYPDSEGASHTGAYYPGSRGSGRVRGSVVKGHTTPESRFFGFFSALVEAQRRQPLATCAVFIAVGGAPTWLPQTLLEVRSPRRRRGPRPLGGVAAPSQLIGALLPSSSKKRLTVVLASEAQARERGSPRPPVATSALACACAYCPGMFKLTTPATNASSLWAIPKD